jgi:hypothetical protein
LDEQATQSNKMSHIFLRSASVPGQIIVNEALNQNLPVEEMLGYAVIEWAGLKALERNGDGPLVNTLALIDEAFDEIAALLELAAVPEAEAELNTIRAEAKGYIRVKLGGGGQ